MAPDQVPEGQPATVVRIDLALMLQLHSLREQLAGLKHLEASEQRLRVALRDCVERGYMTNPYCVRSAKDALGNSGGKLS